MKRFRSATALGLAGVALAVLAMFFDVLVAPGTRVLGAEQTDFANYFLFSRQFGFGELAKGNLALWNPHLFAGVPYFGGMQSALLYPPNALYLFLPLPLAANWSIASNVFLLGAFMYLWGLQRRLHPLAAFVSAVLLMFCGPHFLHIHGGHATLLAAMAWTPLLFLAIDDWLDARKSAACLLGMLAVAMQVLAGSPQLAYVVAFVACGYALLRALEPIGDRARAIAGLLVMYAGGALLSAVQLLPGIEASAESVRGRPLPLAFAASFNFPLENLVTFVAPGFFGDLATQAYWGRWYLWEACGFIGVTGLALAAYGAVAAGIPGKRALLVAAVASVAVALGADTPLFRVLFDWLPMFDQLRGAAKFMFPAALLLVLCAGYGLDRVLRRPPMRQRALWIASGSVLALCAAALAVWMVDWGSVARAMAASGQTFVPRSRYEDAAFLSSSQEFAVQRLGIAILVLVAAAGLIWRAAKARGAALLLGALAVAEIFAFARAHRPTFDASRLDIPQLREFIAATPGDYRILSVPASNRAESMRAFDASGYDPFVARRYAEFIAWSEGLDPALATEYPAFRNVHPLLSMARVQYLVSVQDGTLRIIPGPVPALRRLELIGSYRVEPTGAGVLRALGEPGFDPRKLVILEQQPEPAPEGKPFSGRAAIVREGTDFMDVLAEVSDPAILLVTDAWTQGWRARALDGSSRRYAVMPANHALRAIALDRGRHLLRLEYSPTPFRIGAAVSVAAWIGWLAAIAALLKKSRAPA